MKMILKCNGLLISILLAATFSLSAQKDFRAGFAVLSNGDTLHGFVNYGSPKRNISLCQFRPDKNSSVVEYKPGQLLAYGFTGDKFYESRNYSSSEGVKKVFIEIVVKGKLSILKYGVQFYVQKAPGDLVELKTEQKEKKVNGVIEVITVNSFVGVLNSITQDCPAVHDVVSKTRLSTKSLSEFAVQYNSCVGSKFVEFESKKKWMVINYRLYGGVSSSTMTFSGSTPIELQKSHITRDVTPMFGAGFDFSSPRINEKLFFLIEVSYLKRYFQGDYTLTGTVATNRYDFYINTQDLRIPFGIRYNFGTGSFTPFFKGGFMFDFLLSQSMSGTLRRETIGNPVSTTKYTPDVPFQSPIKSYWLAAGVENRISKGFRTYIELRMENGAGPFGVGVTHCPP